MAALAKMTTNIAIEMSGEEKNYLVSAKQGDRATRYVVARLLNGGVEYTIPTNAKAYINIAKPDGKFVYNSCTFNGAAVTAELTSQALAAAGTAHCDIEIKSRDEKQLITSASFTIEIEKSARDDNAILSSNELSVLDAKLADIQKAEDARVAEEKKRVTAENNRVSAENTRKSNEEIRVQQEKDRQTNTTSAIKNAQDAKTKANNAAEKCEAVTVAANKALQNQEQLENALNTATQIRQDVSQMQSAVTQAKEQVERDKGEIADVIENSLLASAKQILDSVERYFERAEALYSSMHLECDGGNPYERAVTLIVIDGATPQIRNMNEGIDFNGGTPALRLLAS